jgi:CBS domain-containing protein
MHCAAESSDNADNLREVAMKISQAMTQYVWGARPDQSIRDAARIMAELDTGLMPLGENDQLSA